MISFLKWWALAAAALLVIILCSQGAILVVEWINTLPLIWRASLAFVISSMIAGGFMKALFGRY